MTTYLEGKSRTQRYSKKKHSILSIDYWIRTEVVLEKADNLFKKWEQAKKRKQKKELEEKYRKDTYKKNFFSSSINIMLILFIVLVPLIAIFLSYFETAYSDLFRY